MLHDWPDDRAADILAACRAAAGPGTRLLVVDRVLPDDGTHPGVFSDLLMLAACGGRERTRAEWDALLAAAGFEVAAVHEPEGAELAVLECSVVDR
ncbi:hypothetical protein K7G98_06405 [Saccharothrix sp. MB29]|nr:hypothetical protein [Saccharothrix sp. MB29]